MRNTHPSTFARTPVRHLQGPAWRAGLWLGLCVMVGCGDLEDTEADQRVDLPGDSDTDTDSDTTACPATRTLDLSLAPLAHKKDPTSWQDGPKGDAAVLTTSGYLNGFEVLRDPLNSCLALQPGTLDVLLTDQPCTVTGVRVDIVDACPAGAVGCTTLTTSLDTTPTATATNTTSQAPETLTLRPALGMDALRLTALNGSVCNIVLEFEQR